MYAGAGWSSRSLTKQVLEFDNDKEQHRRQHAAVVEEHAVEDEIVVQVAAEEEDVVVVVVEGEEQRVLGPLYVAHLRHEIRCELEVEMQVQREQALYEMRSSATNAISAANNLVPAIIPAANNVAAAAQVLPLATLPPPHPWERYTSAQLLRGTEDAVGEIFWELRRGGWKVIVLLVVLYLLVDRCGEVLMGVQGLR